MVPVGAILVAVVMGLRALNAAQNRSSTPTTTAAAAVQTSRGSSTFWQDTDAGGTIVFQLILSGLAGGLISAGIGTGSGIALSFGLLSFYLLFPAWIARTILAPLGFVRLAYFTASLSRVEWRRDKPGGPAMIAAWALAQQDKPWPSSIAWVEKKLASRGKALQGSGVVAFGLLEAAKGRLPEAREWLDSVLMFDPRVAPVQVRVVAAEWLATDAAARGDWKRVKQIDDNKKWPGSSTLTLLGALAGRMLGAPLPTNAGLWFWWLLAPRRLWTRGFVVQATKHKAKPADVKPLPAPPDALDPMARATFLTLALKGQTTPSTSTVVEVARAWEAALSNELRSKLFMRATLVGGGEPDAAVEEVRQLVEKALGPMLPTQLKTKELQGDLPSLLEEAAQVRKDALYSELEEKMNRMDSRKLASKELPPLEEWREVITLRSLYRQSVESGTASDHSLAHSVIRDKFVNFGVWLYNAREEKPVANAIFRMLEAEAVSLGDSDSEKLNKKNAACDL
jgi:hypothetical protein